MKETAKRDGVLFSLAARHPWLILLLALLLAAAAIAKGLVYQLRGKSVSSNLYLEVKAMNAISDRVVGWKATVGTC